jgi:hypothetical protein
LREQGAVVSDCGTTQVSKALIDLRIENTTMGEKVEGEKFELSNRILTFENDVMELEMKLEQSTKRVRVRLSLSLSLWGVIRAER